MNIEIEKINQEDVPKEDLERLHDILHMFDRVPMDNVVNTLMTALLDVVSDIDNSGYQVQLLKAISKGFAIEARGYEAPPPGDVH